MQRGASEDVSVRCKKKWRARTANLKDSIMLGNLQKQLPHKHKKRVKNGFKKKKEACSHRETTHGHDNIWTHATAQRQVYLVVGVAL